MKANEVNGTHLGQRFRLTLCTGVVEDTLIAIEHGVDVITDQPLCSGDPDVVMGRRHTGLTFLNVGKVGTTYPHTVELDPVE